MTDIRVRTGTSVTIEAYKGKVPEGKEFVAWNTREDGTGVVYKVGKTIQMIEPLRLYPMWRDVSAQEGEDE